MYGKILLPLIFLIGSTNCHAQNNEGNKPVKGTSWDLALADSSVLPMVWIPPGKFMMGSPASEAGRKADEGPRHQVTITKGYWIGRTEVTIGQWKSVMGESLREHVVRMLNDETIYDFGEQKQKLREYMHFDPKDVDKIIANDNDELPMYFVSWHDAMAFCVRLTEHEKAKKRLPENYEYSLPAEAQWEYACRAGTMTSTYTGDLVIEDSKAATLDDICWYGGNSAVGYEGRRLGNSQAGPRNVGAKKPNAWGLYDMPGNIWEWCSDWYGTYPAENQNDPVGAVGGTGKTNRGGSLGSGPNSERSATRASNPAAEKSAYRGFRIALSEVSTRSR
jgi:formylglycine-generating enzyme required for sulfatase activity